MAVIFADQRHIVSRVIQELERLTPGEIERVRNHIDEDAPPPYPESGETTQPPSPVPEDRPVDKVREAYLRTQALNKSRPKVQFDRLAKLEFDRLCTQAWASRRGRRHTFHYEKELDVQANAENNIRESWIDEGIWGEEWGSAWCEGSTPMDMGGFRPEDHPFSNSDYGSRWGHELRAEDEWLPKSRSEPKLEPRTKEVGFGIFAYHQPLSPRQASPPQAAGGTSPPYYPPLPTVRNREASRPLPRFLHEMSREREWVRDEFDWKPPEEPVDLDALVYESVKRQWLDAGLWISDWGEMPGEKWLHEEADEKSKTAPNQATVSQAEQEPLPQASAENASSSSGPPQYGAAETPPARSGSTDHESFTLNRDQNRSLSPNRSGRSERAILPVEGHQAPENERQGSLRGLSPNIASSSVPVANPGRGSSSPRDTSPQPMKEQGKSAALPTSEPVGKARKRRLEPAEADTRNEIRRSKRQRQEDTDPTANLPTSNVGAAKADGAEQGNFHGADREVVSQPPKRRGRPRKNAGPKGRQPYPAKQSVKADQRPSQAAAPKKRRGRPPGSGQKSAKPKEQVKGKRKATNGTTPLRRSARIEAKGK